MRKVLGGGVDLGDGLQFLGVSEIILITYQHERTKDRAWGNVSMEELRIWDNKDSVKENRPKAIITILKTAER